MKKPLKRLAVRMRLCTALKRGVNEKTICSKSDLRLACPVVQLGFARQHGRKLLWILVKVTFWHSQSQMALMRGMVGAAGFEPATYSV